MTTDAPAAEPAVPFRFFTLDVLAVRTLGRSFRRVTFGGPKLTEFRSGGFDQSLSLFLPVDPEADAVLPDTGADTWFAAWRGMPDAERPAMRSYTVRDRRETATGGGVEVDVDFVTHGDSSPASAWAARAMPGRRITAIGPTHPVNKSVRFTPAEGTDLLLMYADETALPAAAAILARLPAHLPVHAVFEVPHPEDRLDLATPPGAAITWVVRADANPDADRPATAAAPEARRAAVLAGVRALDPPAATRPYAWLAGEAGTVRAVRRHLVNELRIDRRAVRFTGYWRLGASEDQLLAEAYAGQAPNEEPESAL
ncbi:siderophore-interacting protein [Streptomyces sp. BI20]|uniref:siderophore-interacting protein n=1 Tax=Streptomyces sp. BI20 TaxID=3403460 RepID=UPI003C796BB1